MPNTTKLLSTGSLMCSLFVIAACANTESEGELDGTNTVWDDADHDSSANSSCECQSCGCDDDDDHESGPPLLEADVDIRLSGFGLAIGLDPTCILSGGNLLDLEVDLFAKAEAEILGHELALVKLDADNIDVELGNGCECTGIEINACVAASLHVEVDADLDACTSHCSGKGSSCMSTCYQPGNKLALDLDLDASLVADLDVSIGGPLHGLEKLLNKVLYIGELKLLDKHGLPLGY